MGLRQAALVFPVAVALLALEFHPGSSTAERLFWPGESATQPTVPGGAPLLWSAGFEKGPKAALSAGGGGGLFNSGSFEVVVSTDIAHRGASSLRARIWTPHLPTSGVRAFRWSEARSRRDLHYSAWIYLPTPYFFTGNPNTGRYWNLFQFKSRTPDGSRSDPLWALYPVPDGAGGLYLRAGWGWGGTALAGPYATSDVSGKYFEPAIRIPLPLGRWVHLEAFLHQSNGFDGRLTFWQDGIKLFDFAGVRTSYKNCTFNPWCADDEWSVNLYSDGLLPNPATLYIDDLAISKSYIP